MPSKFPLFHQSFSLPPPPPKAEGTHPQLQKLQPRYMGAHAAPSSVRSTSLHSMARNAKSTRCLILLIVSLHVLVASSIESESEILLKFKASLSNTEEALANWNGSTSPCTGDNGNWAGVLCSNGTVYGLQLESMGLKGVIDMDSLKKLPNLRTLSFMNNNFDGPLPELKKVGALKSVYLSNNHFSGEIVDGAFDGMLSLKKVVLAQNGFTGKIPKSLTKLPKLLELRLEGNKFEGEIPDFKFVQELKSVNVSNNALGGPIPAGLVKMGSSSFIGNKDLCGEPVGQQCKTSPPPADTKVVTAPTSSSPDNKMSSESNDGKMSSITIATAVVVVGVAIAAIIVGFFILRRRNHYSSSESIDDDHQKKGTTTAADHDLDQMEQGGSPDHHDHSAGSSKKAPDQGRLSFLRDDRERFDLQDLLKASAEILGGGVFGSSYKASLLSGVMMVVKRFRQMNNVGKEEFQEHMRRLGRLRHPNLLPLVAYYYRKEEKLIVSDYVDKGSLAVHLHGNKSRGQPSPDWPARLKIVKGVAKGLVYLYNELPSLITPHGHLKSSNVLLDESYEPLLTDYGLIPVMNQEHAQELMVAYKSPEYTQHGRITKKTDVWSLGILILEILTGRFPANFLQQGKGDDESDLASWVNSVTREEWTGKEVFDNDMEGTKNCEGEMLKLLKIGLACCESDMEKRLDLKEALEKIDELRDFDEEFYSSYTSEGDINQSRGVSDDFNFSMNG